MLKAPRPKNEEERLLAVTALGILDTKPEERFDVITKEATEVFGVPISTISILDKDREWFKSCQGLSAREGDRDVSFCGHALMSQFIFIVEDTLLDSRFADNPNVVGGDKIRFYAGVTLREYKSHQVVGVFCIKDTKPRKLSENEVAKFMELAKRAEDEINKPQ